VRSRPKQPIDAFVRESDAVLTHDAEAQLGKISAPTQITFGRHDMIYSTAVTLYLADVGFAGGVAGVLL